MTNYEGNTRGTNGHGPTHLLRCRARLATGPVRCVTRLIPHCGEEIEKFAHIIFNGNPKQRHFWASVGGADSQSRSACVIMLQPCLHGSDAIVFRCLGVSSKLLHVDQGRDKLRDPSAGIHRSQSCLCWRTTACGAAPSQAIHHVSISNAPWAKTHQLHLNPGLVAIIGPRGSGRQRWLTLSREGATPHQNG